LSVVLATESALVQLYRILPVVPSASVGVTLPPPEAAVESVIPPAAQPVPETSLVLTQDGVAVEKLIGEDPSVLDEL
jgi:hypothetical protein